VTVSPTEPGARAPTFEALAARLRFKHLQLLQALGEGSSLRRAAELIGITQPAATKTLQEIERLFGCRLFERSTRGLVATSAGEILLRGVRLMLADLARVGVEIEAVIEGRAKVLRLGAPPSFAMSVLPGALVRLGGDPALRVRVREASSPELFALLLEGELDAVLARYVPDGDPATFGSGGATLVFERLFDEEMQVAVPLDHRFARLDAVPLAELAGERLILQTESTYTRQLFDAGHRQLGLPLPVPFVESDSSPCALRMVEAGAGIAIQPRWGDPRFDVRWQVRWCRLEPRQSFAPAGLAFRRTTLDMPWLARLRDALVSAITERA